MSVRVLVCPLLLGTSSARSMQRYIWLTAELSRAHLVHLTHNLRFAASEEDGVKALANWVCVCCHGHLRVFFHHTDLF